MNIVIAIKKNPKFPSMRAHRSHQSLDLAAGSSIRGDMHDERMIECTNAKGLFNLALIAAEDAASIASLSPNDLHKIDEDISRLIELGYRIATLGEAIESLRLLTR